MTDDSHINTILRLARTKAGLIPYAVEHDLIGNFNDTLTKELLRIDGDLKMHKENSSNAAFETWYLDELRKLDVSFREMVAEEESDKINLNNYSSSRLRKAQNLRYIETIRLDSVMAYLKYSLENL